MSTMITSQKYTIQFIKKEEVAENTYTFYFARPKEFEFIAGQYNRWNMAITPTDGRGASRFFTISSAPSDTEFITLTTKIIQSDFKKALMAFKEGDEIEIFGPMGQFVLDESDTREKILLAGGIGITPYHSILRDAAEKSLTIPLTLMVSFSTPEEMVFYDELKQISQQHPTIQVVYTVTKPEESKMPWQGETGRISPELIKKYARDINQSVFYLVGPPPMVDGTKKMLEEMGIKEENIKIENFSGY